MKRTIAAYAAWGVAESLNYSALQFKELPGGDEVERAFWRAVPLHVAGAALAGVALAGLTHLVIRRLGAGSATAQEHLARAEPWLAWPLALAVGGGVAVLPQSGPWVQLCLWLAVAVPVLMRARRREVPAPSRRSGFELHWLFFGSGLAALVYQVVWQRTLFSLLGVNVESTTLIVSIFMLGLGIGGLVGGRLSTRLPGKAAQLFLGIELGIGLFATISLPLLHFIGHAFVRASLPVIALVIAGVLLVPTVLMGATLPILVTHLEGRLHDFGRSVAVLYGINTLGSAFACFLTVDLLFVWFGQSGAVAFAAACNLIVGALVFRFIRRTQAAPA